MKSFLTGAALLAGFALAGSAMAAPGQCSMSGFGSFACDVGFDGAGITFELPDGQVFAFALVTEVEGLGYFIAADAQPGQRPVELGVFMPVADEPGCWYGQKDDVKFCALVEQ